MPSIPAASPTSQKRIVTCVSDQPISSKVVVERRHLEEALAAWSL